MSRWMVTAAAAVALFAIAGCGGSTTTVISSPAATTTATTNLGTETEPPSAQDQRIADLAASTQGGRALAQVCNYMRYAGRPQAEALADKMMGPTIIQAGGSIDHVVGLILNKC